MMTDKMRLLGVASVTPFGPPSHRSATSSLTVRADPSSTPSRIPTLPQSSHLSTHHPPRLDSRHRSDSAYSHISPIMPQYTSRDVGDPSQIKKNKQSMADLKLRRLTELNNRLREDLERERIPVSQASNR